MNDLSNVSKNGRRSERRVACLHQLFEEQAQRTPESVAIVFEGKSLTYRQLNRRANRVACALRKLGVGPEVLVGLAMQRTDDLVVGLLGILKAGGAYVPLDPAYPSERLRFMLGDTKAPVLLTQHRLVDVLPKHEAHVLLIDGPDCQTNDDGLFDENPDSGANGENLAYAMFTSGSTGKPKGVLITHENVSRLFDSTQSWFHFGDNDVWSLFHSYAFDFSVWEIWGALLFGGRLVVVPYDVSRSPHAFYKLLVQERVTVLNQTPSAFRQLVHADGTLGAADELALRLIIFGGETLEFKSLLPWIARHGDARPQLVNMYGITETTVHVTYRPITTKDIQRGGDSVIGVPIPDLQVYILDEHLQRVPEGTVGEMFVGGAGLARGYHHRSELTEERFLSNPFGDKPQDRLYRTGDLGRYRPDGDLEYHGRVDQQVQLRGFRVEPGEIEAAVLEHPDVGQAVVVVREDEPGQQQLVAYFVLAGQHSSVANGRDTTRERLGDASRCSVAASLREHLIGKLPQHMIPHHFVNIKALPLTANGKLDRRELPAPTRSRGNVDQPLARPRWPLEQQIADMWCRILKLDQVGIHDRFFEIGGDSIRAADFINLLQRELEEFIFVVTLFQAPTVAEYAAFLQRDYGPSVSRWIGADRQQNGAAPTEEKPSHHVENLISEETMARMRQLIPCHLSSSSPAQNGQPKNPRAAFILAPPRSGTTLLRIMLAGHPRLFAAPELQLLCFSTLAERKAAFRGKFSLWLEGTIRAIMEIHSCGPDDAKQIMREYEEKDYTTKDFYRVLQEEIDGRVLVEKTPAYALDPLALQKAEDDFVDPIYIHLVRHPYAMVRSFESNHVDQVLFLKDHDFVGRELGELVWTLSHQNTLEFLRGIPKERQFRIRFEELTQQPKPIMDALCEKLGLEFHVDMLDPYKDQERKMVDGIYTASTPMGDVNFRRHGRIQPSVADSWKQVDEDDFLGEVTWQVANSLGYPRPNQDPSAAAPWSQRRASARERADLLSQRGDRRRQNRGQFRDSTS